MGRTQVAMDNHREIISQASRRGAHDPLKSINIHKRSTNIYGAVGSHVDSDRARYLLFHRCGISRPRMVYLLINNRLVYFDGADKKK